MPKIGIDIGYYNPRKIVPISFTDGSGSGGVTVLQSWYDSLIVKPSAGLWTDLQIMADGMAADGDWTEMDLFGMVAAMETDEQRLRPLKTTSGADMSAISSPTLNADGVTSNGSSSYIDSNWSPITHGVKFQQTNCNVSLYWHQVGTTSNRHCAGNTRLIVRQSSVDGTSNAVGLGSSTASIFSPVTALGYKSMYRTDDVNVNYFHGVGTIVSAAQTTGVNFVDNLAICARMGVGNIGNSFSNSTQRILIAGSGSINNANVKSRLNTFFTSRGLATY